MYTNEKYKELPLIESINLVMQNDFYALEFLHLKFRPLILKYSKMLEINFEEIEREFDLILLKISQSNITDDKKILKYIKVSLFHIKKNICYSSDELEYIIGDFDVNTDIFFEDIIKDIDSMTQKMLKLKYINGSTLEEISNQFDITRQAVSQRIQKALKKIKIHFNY